MVGVVEKASKTNSALLQRDTRAAKCEAFDVVDGA